MNNKTTDYMTDLQVAFDHYTDAVWDAAEEASALPRFDSTGHVQYRYVSPAVEARLSGAEQALLDIAMHAINNAVDEGLPVNAQWAAAYTLADARRLAEEKAFLGGKDADIQDPYDNLPRLFESAKTFHRAHAYARGCAEDFERVRRGF